jgi:hypothetical protein
MAAVKPKGGPPKEEEEKKTGAAPRGPGGPGGRPSPFTGGPRQPGPGANGAAFTNDDDEEFVEDFEGVTSGFPLYDEDTYAAVLVDFDKSDSKKGKPQYEWEYEFITGQYVGKTIKNWTSLVPNARFKVVEALEAHGVEAADKPTCRFKRSDLKQRPVFLEVIIDTYEEPGKPPKTNNKIARILPVADDDKAIWEAFKRYQSKNAATPGAGPRR